MMPLDSRRPIGAPVPPAPGAGVEAADELEQERRLLARLRAGDESAYEEMVRTHSRRLLAVARRMLGREEDAQDALQDGLLSAVRSLPAFRGESRLSTWLYRIVVNAALVRMRTRRKTNEVPIDDLLPAFGADGHHATTFHPWVDTARAMADEDVREEVRAAIERLPSMYRTILLLRDIDEVDTETVAAMLDLSPTGVKTRLHRARQALVTLLSPTFSRRRTTDEPA